MKKFPIKRPNIPKLKINKQESSRRPRAKLSFAGSILLIFIASLALLGSSGYYWYKNVYSDPDRILSDMLEKSLQTSSIYRTIEQTAGINKSEEEIYLAFSPETIVKSMTTIEEVNQLGKTTAIIEKIGQDDSDYVRYTDIKVTGNNQQQRNFDNVLGVWAKRSGEGLGGQAASFLNDALFTAVPFGNLDPNQRAEVIDEVKRVNLYQYREAKIENTDGRPVITYTMDLDPQSLVQVLAKYVEVTGATSGTALDPAAYEGAQDVRIRLAVDVLSRHVKRIEFLGTERREIYQGYNALQVIEAPSETIDVTELQSRLQAVESSQ